MLITPILQSDDRKVAQDIASLDWHFKNASRDPLDSLHPYPAKFIREIPRTLLQTVSPPRGTTVLDPFCGSGTTLSVAQEMGYSSFGVDLNPIGCLISRVRTGPTLIGLRETAFEVIRAALDSSIEPPLNIPNLDHWFKPEIQSAVASILGAMQSYVKSGFYDALRLALSSILVRVSNQDSDTRYAAVPKNVVRADVFEGFLNAAKRIEEALAGRTWSVDDNCSVLEADTLSLVAEDLTSPISIVITSPPYPNAYEYWLYHKYRMWWLGFDPISVKNKEIGARAHFFKKNPHSADSFASQMETTLTLIQKVLMKGGYACFIIGRSKIHGEIVDNSAIITSVAESRGMVRVAAVERHIAPNRKSFNLSHASIKTESIIVLRKN